MRHRRWLRQPLCVAVLFGVFGCGGDAETKTAPAPNDGSGMGIPGGGPAAGTSAAFPDMPKAAR